MPASVRTVRKKGRYPVVPKGPSTVAVGFPAGVTDGGIVDIAVWNHFGTSRGIPSRPFLLNSVRKHKNRYKRVLQRLAKELLDGSATFGTGLGKLGALASGDVQDEITRLKTPPNAPDTIRQKGSSNPLIWSGRMRGAVTWKID